jgi:methionyl-tRNA synthetase
LPWGGEAEQDVDAELLATVRNEIISLEGDFQRLAPSDGIQSWMRAVFACNAYIDAQAPWALRKTDPIRMEAVLATLYVAIGELAIAISPVIPVSTNALLDQIGIPSEVRSYQGLRTQWYEKLVRSGFTLSPPKPLFPRLELTEAEG